MNEMRDARREIIVQAISRNFEHSESTFKWCVTTLLALNGGALLALIGIDELRSVVLADIGWIFGVGIILAMLSSFFIALAYGGLAIEYAELLWTGDILDRDSFKNLSMRTVGLLASPTIGILMSFGSAICFVFGCMEVSQMATPK